MPLVSSNGPASKLPPALSFTYVTVTCFGSMSGTASGSEPWTIVAFFSCTRARALIAGTTVAPPGTRASTIEPRMYGTSASVCLTSNMRCGVWHGSSMSTLESTKLPTAKVLLLNRVVTRAAPPPTWKL